MVRHHIAARGIRDRRLLAALAATPREWFLPQALAPAAYADAALPIGDGQSISQPFIVALMTAQLRLTRHARVLEIGTGTGYQTAILARLAGRVHTIERLPHLLADALARLARLGLANVAARAGDGALGWDAAESFDAILVTAAAPRVPEPLLAQLAHGGRLVIPVGDRWSQRLVVLERTVRGVETRDGGPVRFVPLVSPLAFPAEAER
ncbi:MAG TPA: protein-L-isoaspartate(D-aspartate) O-methyltransferase [Gemmatimonadales bacterium]